MWAEENTRSSIFEAMKRRETYGTSGPRIILRFFAAESFPENICNRDERIELAYKTGQPMGGQLTSTKQLQFYIEAQADPNGEKLVRGQIIKGWLEDGEPKESVVDVFSHSTGTESFCTTYIDKEHQANDQTFYYARIIEHPSLRWTERKCRIAEIDCQKPVAKGYEACCDEKTPKTIQERAWSSPIWHYPQ